ncbi:MAG: 2Fe-2S iron-sulfur cluster binding domain-containing protein [Spirochaetales bacterium]|nr:2Fe-2S iron-sulfur cluster binding domain-containing protein [Spirochaetales bacterium]
MTIDFILNGEDVSVKAEPMDRLSELLRDRFGLSSVMNDCMEGSCGKCVVLLDGKLVNSCLVPAFKVRGREVISYEGFKSTDTHSTVDEAFKSTGVPLCGFCDAAVYMAAGTLLESAVRPDDDEILETMSSVYCRCALPSAILGAVRTALETRRGGEFGRAR